MELRVLRYFEAVARLGTATAAAEELRVAQPAISRQVRALEREIGTPLLRTATSGSVLTPAGHRFLELTRDLLQRADYLENFVERDGQDDSRLRIACIAATMEHVLPRLIAAGEVRTDHITVVPQNELLDQLRLDLADVCLHIEPPPPPFAFAPVRHLHLTAQLPQQLDRWEPGAAITVGDLRDLPVVTLTTLSPSRQLFDAALYRDRVSVGERVETVHARIAQSIAARRRMACVVTEEAPNFGLRWHPLHSERMGCLGLYLFACWLPDHYLAGTIRRLVDSMQNTKVQSLVRLPTCVLDTDGR